MMSLRYSPLHVTELCGEMQGNFKVGCARLTRRSKIVSRASAMSIEHLLCATVPKVAFVIVLKDACLREICNK